MLGILLLFGTVLGRTICGWLCPLGLIQELLHKVPTYKIKKNHITRMLTWLKYVFLVVFVCAIPLWYGLKHDLPMPGFCKYICPAGTLEGAMGLLSNPGNGEHFFHAQVCHPDHHRLSLHLLLPQLLPLYLPSGRNLRTLQPVLSCRREGRP